MDTIRRYIAKQTPPQTAGIILAVISFFFNIYLTLSLTHKGILSPKYAMIVFLSPLLASLCILFLEHTKSRSAHITGMIFGFLLICLLTVCTLIFKETDDVITKIADSHQKTETIVIAVRADDPAQSIADITNYTVGTQAVAHKKASDMTIQNLKLTTKPIAYDTIQAEANALLTGEISAAVYADSFTDVLNESIENYDAQIRILNTQDVISDTQTEQTDVTKPFCFYISGIDQKGPVNTTGRSDVNIILSVNPDTHKILMVSTPRDYYVPIPGISKTACDKLTHAGIYGPETSIQTLEQLYDIQIPYYAKVNFTSVIQIIDTLGGIDVPVEQSFSSGSYQFNQGIQHMNGKQTLAFCRERKSFTDGDFQRGRNQETVLKAILTRCMQPDILLHTGDLMTTLSESVETSMPSEDIYKLINLQLANPSGWDIQTTSANGTPSTQSCYSYGTTPLSVVIPNTDSVNQLQTQFKENQKTD